MLERCGRFLDPPAHTQLSEHSPCVVQGPPGLYGCPRRAGPAQSPPDQDARARHRQVAPAPATPAKYTIPRKISSGVDHFRAVAKMMRNVTFLPVTLADAILTAVYDNRLPGDECTIDACQK